MAMPKICNLNIKSFENYLYTRTTNATKNFFIFKMKNLDAYTGKLQVELTNNFQEYFGKLSWNFTEQVDETFCLVSTYLLVSERG